MRDSIHDSRTSNPGRVQGSARIGREPRNIPQPVVFRDREQIVRTPKNKSFAPPPQRDREGRPFRASIGNRPPPRTVNIYNDITVVNRVKHYNESERVPGRYYWHRDGGHEICHYYDFAGMHWYGWNIGVNFYWTRWNAGFWWWYDRGRDRWCYWNRGYWWWPKPDRPEVVYVYVNNDYYLPSEAPAEVSDEAPAVEPQAAQPGDQYYRNKDMNRMVRIYGENRDAFLYDASDKPSFRPIFLASGVKDVQMSDADGKPLQILVTKEDGTFEVFDAQGRAYVPSAPPGS